MPMRTPSTLRAGRNVLGPGEGDAVRAVVGSGPQIGAVGFAAVGPSSSGLGAVVMSAQGCEVEGRGRAALVVRRDVVEVAGACVGGAPGEHAVLVAQDDELAHPPRWVMAVDDVG